jgi:beta-lactamase regulating signal transducer with metallopeptidase domain
MIPKFLSAIWAAIAPALGNHLWQSTLCLVVAGLLTWIFRQNHARTRFGIWLAASVKFLIPFSLLVNLGTHLARPRAPVRSEASFFFAMQEVSEPFTQPTVPVIHSVVHSTTSPHLIHLLPAFLVATWFCGFVLVLVVWYARWRRISATVRQAAPLPEGREVEALRRMERLGGIRRPIDLWVSPSTLEPGIFGALKPVLVWPKGISARLDDAQLEAILAHEVWHVRRRDNLTAAIHMVVEALFWFYPLVWWLGARLVDERERACDEEVPALTSERHVYAEGILKTCEFCAESPLVCVAGVAGADLKRRIVRIMTQRMAHKLSLGKKLLLYATSIGAVAGPLVFGLVNGPPTRPPWAQTTSAALPTTAFATAEGAAMPSGSAISRGVYVTPVPGAPFSALALQEMTQILNDGSSFQRKTSALIARDSQGRIHNETHEVIPASSTEDPGLLWVHLYDPNTRANLFLNPYTHIAQQTIVTHPASTVPPANWAQHELADVRLPPGIREEDLGDSVIEGLDVHGYRRTITVSEKLSGTGKPVHVVDEYWYSEELRLDLIMKHDDPRTGSLVITVTKLNVNEPPVELFDVPREYKVVDLTPPGQEESPHSARVLR